MPIRANLLPLALLLAACVEYTIDKPHTPPDEGPPAAPTCEPFAFEAGDAPVDASCEGGGPGGFEPVIEWRDPDLGMLCLGPVVGKLDDDAIPDIVAVGCDLTVVAVSGDGSGTLWTYASSTAVPAIGDLDRDGRPEVVVADGSSVAALDGATGQRLWQGPAVLGPYDHMSGGLALADLNGDGAVEIVAGAAVLSGVDGALLGTGAVGRGSPHPWEAGWVGASFPVVADLDGNGAQEVITGGGAFDMDGVKLWVTHGADGYPAIADFDGDADPEVVVASVGELRLHAHDGALLWRTPIHNAHVGMPTVADFDGDGAPEIVFASDSHLRMVDGDGSVVWKLPIAEWSGRSGAVSFDFEGDGAIEVVFADEQDLYVLDGATGAVRFRESGHASGTDSEAPVVADVDGDGAAEIVYLQNGDNGGGLTVIGDAAGSWMPARGVWNQQAAWNDNVYDDLTIPTRPRSSWLTHNTFRAAPIVTAPPVGPAADLFVAAAEVCTVECADRLPVSIVVGNEGLAAAGGRLVLTAGGEVVAEKELAGFVPGERRQVLLRLDPALAGATVEVRVEADADECDGEDNGAVMVIPGCG